VTIPIVRRWQDGQRVLASHLVFETDLKILHWQYNLVAGSVLPR